MTKQKISVLLLFLALISPISLNAGFGKFLFSELGAFTLSYFFSIADADAYEYGYKPGSGLQAAGTATVVLGLFMGPSGYEEPTELDWVDWTSIEGIGIYNVVIAQEGLTQKEVFWKNVIAFQYALGAHIIGSYLFEDEFFTIAPIQGGGMLYYTYKF